jgi:hypothetical protein
MSSPFKKQKYIEDIQNIFDKHSSLKIGHRAKITEDLINLLRLEHRRGDYWRKKYLKLQEENE